MSDKAVLTTWSAVEHLGGAKLPEKLRAGLSELGNEAVVHLNLPYGEKIIRKGKFRWDLLGPVKHWCDEYGVDIPVAIVATKTVELYDILRHSVLVPSEDHNTRDKQVNVDRSIPLYIVVAGEFFGLFESFTSYSSPLAMRGTAGGTTLVALPPVATTRNVKHFLEGIDLRPSPEALDDIVKSLKTIDESKMAVGPFIKDLLAHRACSWRCDIIILSPTFVDRIRRSEKAKEAIMEMLVEQLVVSHQRSDVMLRVATQIRAPSGGRTDEVQSVHLIADGARPGFVPVTCTDKDEEVLPAKFLHNLLFGAGPFQGRTPLDPKRHFPLLLRPALPGEPCFYLMGRPFFNGHGKQRAAPSHSRITAIFKDLRRSRKALTFIQPEEAEATYPLAELFQALEDGADEVFWEAKSQALTAWLARVAFNTPCPVKLPEANSHFMKLGLIGYEPPKRRTERGSST